MEKLAGLSKNAAGLVMDEAKAAELAQKIGVEMTFRFKNRSWKSRKPNSKNES